MSFICRLTIPSDTSKLSPLREWLASVQRLVGENLFPKKALFPCMLAMVEAVDNAIFHAHGEERSKPIGISLSIDDGVIAIDVTDCGSGMGDGKAAVPDALEDHGRGLFIMSQIMSKVESSTADGNHSIRMEYRI